MPGQEEHIPINNMHDSISNQNIWCDNLRSVHSNTAIIGNLNSNISSIQRSNGPADKTGAVSNGSVHNVVSQDA
jgi:hypothetical protein